MVIFFHIVHTLIWLHYAVSAGDSAYSMGNSACKNVSCAECEEYSKDCICVMVKPQWCIDGEPCETFPKWIPKDQSCDSSTCSPGERCELHDVTCVMAPCWPVKQCAEVFCPVNEEWKDCAAFCEPSCASPAPLCPAVCKPGRCQCKEGFFRRNNMCVPSSGCRGVTPQGPGG